MSSRPLYFAYEKKIGERFVSNGLSENTKYFSRWFAQTEEYAAQDCGSPLKSILQATGTHIIDCTVEECLQSGRHFIYPIEILRSNVGWLLPQCYEEHSPWPAISEATKLALQQNQGVLLLTHFKMISDSTRGDPVKFKLFERLHAALEHFKIPASSVIYVGASPELPAIYEKFVNDNRIATPLKTVQYINYLEKGWQLYFENYRKAGEIFDYESSLSESDRVRPFKFLCFNNEPRIHRKLNLMWLHKKNLFHQGLVSFNPAESLLKFDKKNALPADEEFEQLMSGYNSMQERLPMVVDAPEGVHISFCRRWPFADTYFSFLTERVFDCQTGWTLLTPKVFKSICNMHPFVVLGQHGYLDSLREFGYKTFSPYIDESYDKIVDPVTRTKAVWAEVEKLNAMSLQEMHQWYYSLFPILKHNWTNFLHRSKHSEYNNFIKILEDLNGV